MLKKISILVLLFFILFLSVCNVNPENNEPEVSKYLFNLLPGVNDLIIEHDGLDRTLYIVLPADIQADKLYPVVFFFHNYTGTRSWGKDIFSDLISEEDFIGVSPHGSNRAWNDESGHFPSTADDVGFTLKILEKLDMYEGINIKKDQIYSFGKSNGAIFSYYLARMTDKFAAIAPVAGSFYDDITITNDVPKISVFHLHGDLDYIVPFNGAGFWQSAMDTVMNWVRHNKISEIPTITTPEEGLTYYTFKDENNPFEVILGVMKDTAHDIETHPFINSNRWYFEIWEFFKRNHK